MCYGTDSPELMVFLMVCFEWLALVRRMRKVCIRVPAVLAEYFCGLIQSIHANAGMY
jgi:hypothetical protein